MMSLKYCLYAGLCAVALFTGCSVVDEDLSDCATDVRMNYKMHLVTNMSTEMDNVLNHQSDQYAAAALRDYLKDIFSDKAHDLNLAFWSAKPDDPSITLRKTEMMDASEASYIYHLPVRPYVHLGSANVEGNKLVSPFAAETAQQEALPQVVADTITSHTTGLFTGRLPFEVLNKKNQEYTMYLYMANCAAALVVDTTGVAVTDMKVYTTGFATDFNLCDSIYTYGKAPIVVADKLPVTEGKRMAFCTVNYPSAEVPVNGPTPIINDGDLKPYNVKTTRLVTETTEPFEAEEAQTYYWQYRCYVTKADGKITETILGVKKPLRAGQLTIVKAKIESDGEVIPIIDGLVGVTVNLDWTPGNTYNPTF